MPNEESAYNLRKQAWDYFQMHGSQRLTTFNFYLFISALTTTGLASTFQKDFVVGSLGVPLGILLAFFSFVFWKLDTRNRVLIKYAEDALKYFETQAPPQATEVGTRITRIFLREEAETAAARVARPMLFWRRNLSFSSCFNLVFVSFGVVGIGGAVTAVLFAR